MVVWEGLITHVGLANNGVLGLLEVGLLGVWLEGGSGLVA